MEFIRTKCLSPHCPAMACPSQTGYCSHHDLQRTPCGKRPGYGPDAQAQVVSHALLAAKPTSELVQ
jgi:hypothetical protein